MIALIGCHSGSRCEDYRTNRAVAFSYKHRSLYSNCLGRRIADTTTRLCDEMTPRVTFGSGCFSLPFQLL